ncbi:hypothetical protein DFP72DRAFT_823129 [Ephemerocybe angulata]|uniref:DUF6589 domain-containing protein n=1 Tax=Ephemerocybe angulata TaxID=980116 RepID=A0A8H6HHL8_9AGAR|nr:hypothetical protein DFP72DRAFT_823129 [Tulosesus angulatus]
MDLSNTETSSPTTENLSDIVEVIDDDERSISSGDASDIETNIPPVPNPPSAPNETIYTIPKDVEDQYIRHTRAKREQKTPHQIYQACTTLIAHMKALGLDLPIFLDAVFWGNDEAIDDRDIQYERTVFLRSLELPRILENWRKPPRSSHSITRPAGGTKTMNSFAVDTVVDLAKGELSHLGPQLHLSTTDDVSPDKLTSINLVELEDLAKDHAPILWSFLKAVLDTGQGKKWRRVSASIAFTIISMISYTQSHHHNRLQKLLAVYMKFRGVSAKGFDTLHAMGLTMSHKWTCDAVERISSQCMSEVVAKMKQYPWLISYDNINIPFRVFSQRVDNRGEFGNGTAATVYIKRDAPKLPDGITQLLKETRAAGLQNPLTASNINDLASKSYPRIQEQMAYLVLRFLLDSPEFDFGTYKYRKSSSLRAPKAVDQLPTGDDHITLQYLLGTTNIAEASYEDNARLIDEWLSQLGWMTEAQKREFALAKLVFWCGDQLTVDRLRHLFIYRGSDDTSYDRMDYSVLLFGWFHLQMAYANSLHRQYLGTERGRGLQHAFDLLNRKGLTKVLTQGPFHHNLDEALRHVAEAHIREDWLEVAEVESLAELRSRPAEELKRLAMRVVKKRASSEALDKLDSKGAAGMDEELRQVIMWNRDVLQYLVLDAAVKSGDVGMMESMLPHLLYRFSGSGNSKYAIEVLELMQGLYREWPKDVADFARHHCWLVNTTGKPGKFCPVDMAQEHNIRDIKVTYRSQGPNIKWGYLKRLHPAIHVIRKVTEYIEKEFGTLVRGSKHTIPKAELDIEKLRGAYHETGLHSYKAGRRIKVEAERAEDYMTEGAIKLNQGKGSAKWNEGRNFERSDKERVEEDEDVEMAPRSPSPLMTLLFEMAEQGEAGAEGEASTELL